MKLRFANRTEAGKQLAKLLEAHEKEPGLLVLALPRGGVPVAYEVAKALRAPLDVIGVRKLGVPGNPELAMGAITTGGVRVLNDRLVAQLGITQSEIDQITGQEQQELARREFAYRHHRPPIDVRGRTVIVVDDGIATGSSMRAAIAMLRLLKVGRLIIATPTAAWSTAEDLRSRVDEFYAVMTPENFNAVCEWYTDFTQTTDEEVKKILDKSIASSPQSPPSVP